MAQGVIIMSAKDQLANDAVQIKNKRKDGTNWIQVEAEEEDDPQ